MNYRQRLLELGRRVQDDVSGLTGEALRTSGGEASGSLSNAPLHLADLGTDNFEQVLTLSLLANQEQVLDGIADALQRIEAGTYARCEVCHAEIAEERLEVLPYTSTCIQCARRLEGDQLILEYRTTTTSMRTFKSDAGDVRVTTIRLDDVESMAVGRRWPWGAKLRIRTRTLAALQDAPGAQGNELVIPVRRSDYDRARTLCVNLSLELSSRELKQLEDEGDRVVRDAIASLFHTPGIDPLLVLKWKDIYEGLEDALDGCEKVANVIANIVVKNV